MYFNSIIFIILFLPVLIILVGFAGRKNKNLVALLTSILFFGWNQFYFLPLIGATIIWNYYMGKAIDSSGDLSKRKRALVVIVCATDILMLIFFKLIGSYGVNWLPNWLPAGLVKILNQYIFPLGFSYIIFQLISYQIDVSKGICKSEKSLYRFSIFVMLFPKIMVGPIVRYRDLFGQIIDRESNSQNISDGLRRFIRGFAKKTLIADTIAITINPAFALTTPNFSTWIAWFVLIGYALQLYFDFSGYTDMAIGLGQVMGFRFMENFNYPYISRSIAEFWRRWHISLSTWFREYVFYPLERSRRKFKFMIQPLNLLIVFLLVGLWHGITYNFIIWGGIQGIAMALEVTNYGRWLKKQWVPLQHFYTVVVILIGWVFFRSSTLSYAVNFFARLIGSSRGITQLPFSITKPLPIIDPSVWLAIVIAIIFSLPIMPGLQKYWVRVMETKYFGNLVGRAGADMALFAILILSVAAIVSRSNIITSIYAKF